MGDAACESVLRGENRGQGHARRTSQQVCGVDAPRVQGRVVGDQPDPFTPQGGEAFGLEDVQARAGPGGKARGPKKEGQQYAAAPRRVGPEGAGHFRAR